MTTDQKVRGSTPLGRAIRREVAQLGRALGLGPRGRRFESCLPDHFYNAYGALAQLGERLLCTQEVSGSIPLGSTKIAPAPQQFEEVIPQLVARQHEVTL